MIKCSKYIGIAWMLVHIVSCGLINPNDNRVVIGDEQPNVQSANFDESSPYIALALAEGWYGNKYVAPLDCYVRCAGNKKRVEPANFAFDVVFSASVGELAEQKSWENSAKGKALTAHIREQVAELNGGNDYCVSGPNKTQYIFAPLSSVKITADTRLWGRESGDNLADKFVVAETAPSWLFSYPFGQLLDVNEMDGEVDMLALMSKSLTPLRIRFAVTEPFAEKPNVVNYTIRLTLNKITMERLLVVRFDYE